MNNPTISIRRHAKTDKSGKEALSPQRIVSPEGRTSAYELGENLRSENILGAYTSPALRSQQTLAYLMDSASQLDFKKMFVQNSLNEPFISPEYRKIANANERTRDERIAFYLENQDPTGDSTTPYEAACDVSFFINEVNEKYEGNSGRVEAITNAPKLEAFLQIVDENSENSFTEHLDGRSFDHLEGIELEQNKHSYIAHVRDKEIQIPKSKIEELANAYLLSWMKMDDGL